MTSVNACVHTVLLSTCKDFNIQDTWINNVQE